MKLDPLQPRLLRFRSYYRLYVIGFSIVTFLLFAFWLSRIAQDGFNNLYIEYSYELVASTIYFVLSAGFYFLWLRARLHKAIQVFDDHLLLHKGKHKEKISFDEIESVHFVWGSLYYVKLKTGTKHYFDSSFERIDYIWEGISLARPDIVDNKTFETFRLRLVQYDHHQKRKEWFFKHKLVDFFNWAVLPLVFVAVTYIVQSRNVEIHQQGLYFFRLFMYSMLVTMCTAFLYSILLKKLIFDKKIQANSNIDQPKVKVRDLEFEGVILQRTKMFQFFTACFVLAVLVKYDVNFYSVTKVKEDVANFNFKKGKTILLDSRYNCLNCKYTVHDGDFVLFGRGIIGQVLAKEGDFVGEVAKDQKGRMIASENVQEVPKGHVAIKAANGKDILFVKIEELIGKIQN